MPLIEETKLTQNKPNGQDVTKGDLKRNLTGWNSEFLKINTVMG